MIEAGRPRSELTPRPGRVRCAHCSMPVRGTVARCWSCGLDPAGDGEPSGPGAVPAIASPGLAHPALLLGAGLVVALALLGGSAVLRPASLGDHGVRNIAARLQGATWGRAEVLGVSASFPALPVRSSIPPGRGLPPVGGYLVATGSGLRTELLVFQLAAARPGADGQAAGADALVDGYASFSASQVLRRAPLVVHGGSGLDAVLRGAGGQVRVRATVVGATGYLMAVTGPDGAFRRFTASFEGARTPVPPVGP